MTYLAPDPPRRPSSCLVLLAVSILSAAFWLLVTWAILALLTVTADAQTRIPSDRRASVTYQVRIDGTEVDAVGMPRVPAPTERLRVRIAWDWYEAGGWQALGRLGDERTVEVGVLQPPDPSGAAVWTFWSVTRRWVAADTMKVGGSWQIVLEFEAERERVAP